MQSPLCLALALAATPTPPDAAARLLGATLADGRAMIRLEELTDTVGARLTGSPGAEAGVAWALRSFEADGLKAWSEPVTVPVWVRGEERAEVVAGGALARPQPLAVTALGHSPGTGPAGLTAEVLEVRSLEEVAALGERARGKIIFFDHAMAAGGSGYGDNVRLRSQGPAAAARVGAAGALVRSLATASLRSPHTGQTTWPADVVPIPAAALAVEDAELLHRLLARARGPVAVHLVLGCGPGTPATAESANVVAELRGRERPEEVVLLGAHLDSWDLGTGAIDDGAGVVMVMEALRQVARLPVAPRRTVRVVLFMNEEAGLEGGKGYAARHAAELGRLVAAVEADSGAARPLGFSVGVGPGGRATVERLLAPLAGIGAAGTREGDGGSDISPLHEAGVPVLGLWQDTSRYFDWHHSAADTLDRVVPGELTAGAAALAVVAWQLAEAAAPLPRAPVAPPAGASVGASTATGAATTGASTAPPGRR